LPKKRALVSPAFAQPSRAVAEILGQAALARVLETTAPGCAVAALKVDPATGSAGHRQAKERPRTVNPNPVLQATNHDEAAR
jgi:hypothetical protein